MLEKVENLLYGKFEWNATISYGLGGIQEPPCSK